MHANAGIPKWFNTKKNIKIFRNQSYVHSAQHSIPSSSAQSFMEQTNVKSSFGVVGFFFCWFLVVVVFICLFFIKKKNHCNFHISNLLNQTINTWSNNNNSKYKECVLRDQTPAVGRYLTHLRLTDPSATNKQANIQKKTKFYIWKVLSYFYTCI